MPETLSYPDVTLDDGDAASILQFCFGDAVVSDRVRSNVKAAYESYVRRRARREANRWAKAKDGWVISAESEELRAELRKGLISDETYLASARAAEARRIIALEDEAPRLIVSMVDTVARAGQARNLSVGSPPEERAKVMSHEVAVLGGTSTVGELTERFATPQYLAAIAFSDNDVAVIDELRRTQLLAADPHAAEVERLVSNFRDQLDFG